MLDTLSRLSHCNLFILLRPLARLLYGTNHDTCDGLEEQGHDGHCHLGNLAKFLMGTNAIVMIMELIMRGQGVW